MDIRDIGPGSEQQSPFNFKSWISTKCSQQSPKLGAINLTPAKFANLGWIAGKPWARFWRSPGPGFQLAWSLFFFKNKKEGGGAPNQILIFLQAMLQVIPTSQGLGLPLPGSQTCWGLHGGDVQRQVSTMPAPWSMQGWCPRNVLAAQADSFPYSLQRFHFHWVSALGLLGWISRQVFQSKRPTGLVDMQNHQCNENWFKIDLVWRKKKSKPPCGNI